MLEDSSPIPRLLSVRQVADSLQTSERFVLELIYQGELEAAQIGSVYRIPERAIIDYYERSKGRRKQKGRSGVSGS
jgi:excisionase family DNA binding protein